MNTRFNHLMPLFATALMAFIAVTIPNLAIAHCDTMDGPVIKAAQEALETREIARVLIWVQPADEETIRKAFEKTLRVRNQSLEAKELADNYFFETLVRIHRAGEGVPYTGIKPAGADIEPGIAAADKALENGSVDFLIDHLAESVQRGVLEKFNTLQALKNYKKDDIEAGREAVEAYVVFIHYVERLFLDAEGDSDMHSDKSEAEPVHREH